MKVLEKEKAIVRKGHARIARSVAAPHAPTLPSVVLRTRTAARPSLRRSRVLAEWSSRAVAFASLVGLTYVGSTLGGYVMLERARQASRQGADRGAFARSGAKAARASIETLSNPATLAAWGAAHGFVASGPTSGPTTGAVGVAKD